MYWLLNYEQQENIRLKVVSLQNRILSEAHIRNQQDQIFPFVGRKDRHVAQMIIEELTNEGDVICDPFSGSGTFVFAAQDTDRRWIANEWEPFAHRMSSAILREVPDKSSFEKAKSAFIEAVKPAMMSIYGTICPECGKELMFDGLFFDRDPEEYFSPQQHERLGKDGQNVIFRQKRKCSCGCEEKRYDDYDEFVRQRVLSSTISDFPIMELIENSRINFTAPDYTCYGNLFSQRQKFALMTIKRAILQLDESVREFFEDTLISIIHLAKYTDYRSKSQDNHCPSNRLKETNLFFRFLEKLDQRYNYISDRNCKGAGEIDCKDFREFLSSVEDGSVDLVLTDPPYGDNAQYFEHAQRVHPFLGYDLKDDLERLTKEVVISNAPSRRNKHGKEQFYHDIDVLISESSRILSPHGFLVLYFRPEQRDWITDLNTLKHFGRKYGLEPLVTIPIDNRDPSMRALASVAWTFKNDVCFIFLKLDSDECRWYVDDIDVDELIYLSAKEASENGNRSFMLDSFYEKLSYKFRKEHLMKLMNPVYQDTIDRQLSRFTVSSHSGGYCMNGLRTPYDIMNKDMDAELRLREFAPVVIEELTANGKGFTFEEYVVQLSSYLENGSKEIISRLHCANRLVPELLLKYAEENKEQGLFYAKKYEPQCSDGQISLITMTPSDFEVLIADYFKNRGYIDARVIGRSGDRGVDVIVTNIYGEYELVQCKRYRPGNNIGSTPIQRIDSYMRSRKAVRAWVITTSDFTPEGIDEARILGIKIINGAALISSLELYYPGVYSL